MQKALISLKGARKQTNNQTNKQSSSTTITARDTKSNKQQNGYRF